MPATSLPTNITDPSGNSLISRIAGSFMRRAPWISPIYNAVNTGVHLAQGTAGRHGVAPSVVGKLMQLFNPNFGAGGAGSSPSGFPTVGGSAPVGPGSFAGDPTDPNNPGAYSLSGGQPSGAIGGGAGVGMPPNVGSGMGQAGSLNFWNNAFPGSALGRFAPSNNTFALGRGGMGLGTPNQSVQGIPAWAAAAMADVRSRNIA